MLSASIAVEHARPAGRARSGDALAAIIGMAALCAWVASAQFPAGLNTDVGTEEKVAAKTAEDVRAARLTGREHVIGGYTGVSYTQPSAVRIVDPGATDLTVSNFGWLGRPFKSPIYYGLRTQHWPAGALTGAMIDFTHAKAIAEMEDTATFTGTHKGQPLPPSARLGDVFRHLEFSHGHNIVTLNGLLRSPRSWLPLRPYFGLGGGVSLPHTEIGLRSETLRTYEYQFAGFAGQFLVGFEVPFGRASVFFEYKFTYAPYSVPLSHEPYGWLLVTDLWRQFRAWISGEKPPGGMLMTTLATHHGISGLLVRATMPKAVR